MSNTYKAAFNNKQELIPTAIKSIRVYLLTAFVLNLVVVIAEFSEKLAEETITLFDIELLTGLEGYLLSLLAFFFAILVLQSRYGNWLVKSIRWLYQAITSLGFINWLLFGLLFLLYGYYQLAGLELHLLEDFPQILIFGYLGLLGAIILSGTRKLSPSSSLLVTFSVFGVFLWVLYYIPAVHTYPLTYGWSETSRYYYASLYFSPLIYGNWVPLSPLHPSRYLLQSLPFILPSLPLWFHRLWQVLLWLGFASAASIGLCRRIRPQKSWVWVGVFAWFFIFIMQGPVYYHLLVSVIIVLFGFNRDRLNRTLVFVVLASIWAGISRVNWFPVPGMLAAALYVLEVPQGNQSFWQYWRWPIITVLVGFAVAFFSQAGFAAISGKPPEAFASSFRSPLYTFRLFPNEAFGPGIINLTITASFPLLAVIFWRGLPNIRAWRFLRVLALAAILGALLVVGLIVSSKIGGGNNLHNMDAYLFFLAVYAAYLGFNRFDPDLPKFLINRRSLSSPLTILAFLVPIIFVIDLISPYPQFNHHEAWEDIQLLQTVIDQKVSDGGEVLFIQQRHLLTFNMIEGVDLVPEYEKVFLMEMAMSNNQTYLNNFYHDLETRRFDLIVSEPLMLVFRRYTDRFAFENNAWVERVGIPLADHYETIHPLTRSGMHIMVPKPLP